MKASIPFHRATYIHATAFMKRIQDAKILYSTRGDELVLTFQDDEWYVIIKTQNLRGMIADLEYHGFM